MKHHKHTQIGHTIIWGVLAVAVLMEITGIFSKGGPGSFLVAEVDTPHLRGLVLQTDN